MRAWVPKELYDSRVAVTPSSVKRLTALGISVLVEKNAGIASNFIDDEYKTAGAEVVEKSKVDFSAIDTVLCVNHSLKEDIGKYKENSLHVSFLNPFENKEVLQEFAQAKVNAVSLEKMPRTTLAQKMDALSSQANLAGYFAVLNAANEMNACVPMMATPAGTIHAARFFIVGAGVAGLQAIATARRLGAQVEAFDTRPEVEEQVKSLGARFVKVDLGETESSKQGYAKALTEEQLKLQRQKMSEACVRANVVITTAKIFGRKAPLIINNEILQKMRRGSVIVDLAVESGGNVEGSALGKKVTTDNGVMILGEGCWEGKVAHHASEMYSSNIYNLIEHIWDKEKKCLNNVAEDDLLKQCLVVYGGEIL